MNWAKLSELLCMIGMHAYEPAYLNAPRMQINGERCTRCGAWNMAKTKIHTPTYTYEEGKK